MKKAILLFILFSCLQSCIAPLNTTFESAKTIGKGGVELKGYKAVSNIDFVDVDSNSSLLNEFVIDFMNTFSANLVVGGSIGYGVTDNYDIKLRGDFMMGIVPFELGYSVGLVNKIGLIENYLALNLPISYNHFVVVATNEIPETIFMVSPQLLISYPFNGSADITFATKVDIPLNDNGIYTNPLVSYTLGSGFQIGEDTELRIEAGYSKNYLENRNIKFRSWTIGGAVIYKF